LRSSTRRCDKKSEMFTWEESPLILTRLVSLSKYVIKKRGVSYRIVYEIVPSRRQVLILMVGKREGFYERFLKRLKR